MNSKQELIDYWKSNKIITDKILIEAFNKVDRKKFVLHDHKYASYHDRPLPIPAEQTISQPTTVVIMLQALELKKDDVVLEIGAGSGYNAAIMSKLVKKVYAIEIIEELAKFATQNLKDAGIKNVKVIHGDGSMGYEKKAPYDKAIITAAAPKIPKQIIEQTKIGGIIVAPVGKNYQEMLKVRKMKKGLRTENLGEFVFVPLRGKYGHKH